MSVVAAAEGYRQWAGHYECETVVSQLEALAVASLGIPTAGRALLDAGCGTARRLRHAEAALRVGVDLTPAMLAYAESGLPRAAGDVCALPLAAGVFDVVWCRLVIGHVDALDAAYAELARVCREGGHVVVTDFHPDAAAAGHARTFRDPATGEVRAIAHHVHPIAAQLAAARRAGLEPTARREGRVGPEVRAFYAATNRLHAYEAQVGLPLVLALAYRKGATP